MSERKQNKSYIASADAVAAPSRAMEAAGAVALGLLFPVPSLNNQKLVELQYFLFPASHYCSAARTPCFELGGIHE